MGQLPTLCFTLSEGGEAYNVVQSPETVATAPQPADQVVETKSASMSPVLETAVQRHRRIKKEKRTKLFVEELFLSVELAEKMKKMTELNAEIRILSRLTRAGNDITKSQMVQGWVNKAADAER